jgi:O-antigen ligase
VVLSTVALVAWGVFAFGSPYPWAYGPLAVGSALVGVLGLVSGSRPVWAPNRVLLLALAGVGVVALVQLIPLPLDWLNRISPGTLTYLWRYDLRYQAITDPFGDTTAVLTHAVSIAPAKTILFIQLFLAAALLLVGLLRTLSRTTAMRLTKGVVFTGFVLAVFGIAQKAVLGDQAFDGMRIYGFWQPESLLTTPFGPFVNKNHFGGWMLMGIPLALSLAMASVREDDGHRRDLRQTLLWLSEPEGGRMLFYLVMALVMGLALMMTGSRSSIAALTLMVGGMAVVRGRQNSARTTVVLLLAAVAVLAAGLQWVGSDARLDRFTTDNESLTMRLAIWRMSAETIQAFPLLGTGLNTFGAASIVYQPGGDLHFNEAHNDYIQLLVEGGLVTFLFVVVAIAGVVWSIRARFAANEDGTEARWLRVGASAGLVAIGLQALVEFSLQMPGNAVLFVVLLALALYVPAPYRPAPR